MKILVTNDDGINAPGLLAIVRELRALPEAEVTVLAPDKNWSACGHVKTMSRPLRLNPTKLEDGSAAWMSDGAPSDCVALGMMGALEQKFDLVVSGINPNANVGLDVTYSGTVTAAMEACIHGKPGFAVSIDAPEFHRGELDFNSAAKTAARLVFELFRDWDGKQPAPIWNINLPYSPERDYDGVRFTRQGTRYYHDRLEKRFDPRGVPYYWIGGDPPSGLVEEGTDYGVIKSNFVSVTPLAMEMTDRPRLEKLLRLKQD
jgi:5'-nucleotidase